MFSVKVDLPDNDGITGPMETMRTWLDDKGYYPISFKYNFSYQKIVVDVQFERAHEAAEFEAAFNSKVTAHCATPGSVRPTASALGPAEAARKSS